MKKLWLDVSLLSGLGIASLFLSGYSGFVFAKEQPSVQTLPSQEVTKMPHRDELLDGPDQGNLVQLGVFQQASQAGDISHVPAMVAALDHPTQRVDMYLLPRLLARMGAVSAVPVLDSYIADRPGSLLSDMARVSKSRLLAENAVRSLTDDRQRSSEKIHRFLLGLNLAPADLNSALISYRLPEVNKQGRNVVRPGGRQVPLEVMAVEEIADIVYSSPTHSYLGLPEVSQINFQGYYPAALKMRLAPCSRQQRIAIMISDLSTHTVLRGEDDYEIQLLANEGQVASVPVANKLRQMSAERSSFSGAGFSALFSVLAGIGDSTQLTLVQSFVDDQNPTVANRATLASQSLENRSKRFMVWGY